MGEKWSYGEGRERRQEVGNGKRDVEKRVGGGVWYWGKRCKERRDEMQSVGGERREVGNSERRGEEGRQEGERRGLEVHPSVVAPSQ